MLIFYEGRPGSGKSLCAIKEYVVPMLAKHRKVFAYVEGLNHKQIAELAGIDLEKCIELLQVLTREQVPHFYKFIENDAFVVIDEVQNFFPKGRKPLDQETANFFAEYRHLGLDILLMGQVFAGLPGAGHLQPISRKNMLRGGSPLIVSASRFFGCEWAGEQKAF